MLKSRHLYRKKAVLVVLLLVTSMGLLFYSRFAGTTKLITEVINSDSSEGTSSACAEELSSLPIKHDVLQALREDGYHPIALSEIHSNTLTPKQDSIKTRELQSLGLSENCTKHRSEPIETWQVFVPNVVHYVFIGSDFQFKFIAYLSFLSVERFLKPDQIFIHGDVIPSGRWWNATVEQVKNIYHIQMSYPIKAPNGQPFKYMAHISDYMRAEILLRYGGIYLDPDVLVLKSFHPLRQFPFVLGRETEGGVGNGIIIARKGAPFLRLMLEQYWSYMGYAEDWAKLSVLNLHTLAQLYPHLIHVEEESLNRPNWMEMSLIYEGNYNWETNYAMHLWIRLWPNDKLPSELQDIPNNTTLGEIVQHILFVTH